MPVNPGHLLSDQAVATNGRAINSATLVVPYRPGYPQIMVTTYPYDDKHNTEPEGEYPVLAIDDGSVQPPP